MIDIAKGRYWDKPLSLVDGCTPCSPGCEHCWAAVMTHRFIRCVGPINAERMRGEPILTDADGRFNGRILIHPERLSIPLKCRKPTVYSCWNDLFHEAVPDYFRHTAYAVMTGCGRHIYLVLTKRPAEMAKFVNEMHACAHIYHGLTVCNQQEADEKIPVFLQVPGKKFLSIEPMLGAINFRWKDYFLHKELYREYLERTGSVNHLESMKGIAAVILGGENGPGARPIHADWAISIVRQCRAAGVPVFVKQIHINGKMSKDMNEWPEELRERELPWLNHNLPSKY